MTSQTLDPIRREWSIPAVVERAVDDELAAVSARELAQVLAKLEVDEIAQHHVELVTAVAELARSAGNDWPWTSDDPTVALLRAVAMLAINAPDVTSRRAGDLYRTLDA